MNKNKKTDRVIAAAFAVFVGAVCLVSVLINSKNPTRSPNENGFSFLCSKKESGGHMVDYYETLNVKAGDHLVLNKKITDVTVSVSKTASSGGWNIDSLCGNDSLVDLASADWQVLTIGKDCGYGASVESCDLDTMEDKKGISELILNFTPKSNSLLKINSVLAR